MATDYMNNIFNHDYTRFAQDKTSIATQEQWLQLAGLTINSPVTIRVMQKTVNVVY